MAGCCGGVDRGALNCKNSEAEAAVGEVVVGVHEMALVEAEGFKFSQQACVTSRKCLQAYRQLRAVVLLPGSTVVIRTVLVDAGEQKHFALEVGGLRSDSSGYTRITHSMVSTPVIYSIVFVKAAQLCHAAAQLRIPPTALVQFRPRTARA